MPNRRLGTACAFALIAISLSCGGEGPGVEPEVPVPTTLTLTPPTAELNFVNATVRLSASVFDQNGSSIGGVIDWSSDDLTVATVGATGIVRAVANGTVTITAAIGAARGTVVTHFFACR